MAGQNDLADYEVTVNGIVHTFQLDADTASRTPGAKRKRSVALAEPTSTDAENAALRAGIASPAPATEQPARRARSAGRRAAGKRTAKTAEAAPAATTATTDSAAATS